MSKIRTMVSHVHSMAAKGFAAGTNELYDRARPTFPQPAIDALYASLPSRTAPLNILEMGCGTGLFTRSLLANAHFSARTGSLLATDPSEGMLAVFKERLANDSRVSCAEGTFDRLPAKDGWADLVVAAQAWHWCPNHDAALTEIRRALKPDGVFAVIWNMEDRDAARWVSKLRDVYEPYDEGTPQFRLMLWRDTFECATYKAHFLPPEEPTFPWIIQTTKEGVVDRVLTKSYIATLPEDEKKKVMRQVEAIVDEGTDRVWIDREKGVFEYPYKTYLVIMKQK